MSLMGRFVSHNAGVVIFMAERSESKIFSTATLKSQNLGYSDVIIHDEKLFKNIFVN